MNSQEFKNKYWKFHHKLYKIAYSLTGNKEDAEDIVQSVYHKLWLKRMELEAIKNPEGFCVTLTKNKALDVIRLRKKELDIDSELPYNVDQQLYTHTEDQMNQKELLHQVVKSIHSLPYKQQQIIRLSAIEGVTHQEIESITGETNANIRSLLSRARSTIRQKFNNII